MESPSFTADAPAPYRPHQRIGLLLGPAAAAVLLLMDAPPEAGAAAWRTAAVGLWMAVWWTTEALPIAATALLPLVLFPLLGVLPMDDAAAPYAHPLIFLFMGGFLLALGMERWGLHRRIALRVVRLIGTSPRAIVGGFMVAAAGLSMWVSNTATAMMMLPIGLSVVALDTPDAPAAAPLAPRTDPFAVALMLGLAYACSIGGIATLVGTPTNAFLAGFMSESYGVELSFAAWMLVGGPVALAALPVAYLLLTRVVFVVPRTARPAAAARIDDAWKALGPASSAERRVGAVFAGVAGLWITRPLLDGAVPGLTDTGIAIGGALVLFVLPAGGGERSFLLDWSWARRLPWGVLLLFGGGLSLAAAVTETGLADWIGAQMTTLAAWPPVLLVGAVVTVIVLLTELTSNTATAAAFLPVLAAVAAGMGADPLTLAVPATIAASCAFMLPVATPPNAIVYGSSFVTLPQMARAGAVLNAVIVVLVTALCALLVPLVLA